MFRCFHVDVLFVETNTGHHALSQVECFVLLVCFSLLLALLSALSHTHSYTRERVCVRAAGSERLRREHLEQRKCHIAKRRMHHCHTRGTRKTDSRRCSLEPQHAASSSPSVAVFVVAARVFWYVDTIFARLDGRGGRRGGHVISSVFSAPCSQLLLRSVPRVHAQTWLSNWATNQLCSTYMRRIVLYAVKKYELHWFFVD